MTLPALPRPSRGLEAEALGRRVVAFVRALRAQRRMLELSQRELAARAGIGEKHLGEIERGLRDPRLSTLLRLLDALDRPASDLLRWWDAGRRIEPVDAGEVTAR
jgi:transcriptional regulator with XRE-family HTH domain